MISSTETSCDAPGGSATPDDAVVLVLFKGRRLELFANPDAVPADRGDLVLVEVERGTDIGEVADANPDPSRWRWDAPRRRILRRALPEEQVRLRAMRAEDGPTLEIAKERTRHFDLPMHMIDAEQQFDGNRLTFYFTADHRVDFRELVRDLASIFRTRIELRQIGLREAVRRLGGLGPCGREVCCCSHLQDLERISLQAAREKKLAPNPARMSGLCGRLLCCLNFEDGKECGAGCGGLAGGSAFGDSSER